MHPISQKFVKKVDLVIGKLIIRLMSRIFRKRISIGNVNSISSDSPRILIIRPGGLGDAILLTPAVRMLIEKIPSAKIHYLGEKRNIEGAKLCYGDIVEEFFLYDSIRFIPFLIFNIKKYDVVIDTEQSFLLPAVVARIVGRVVFGFDTTEKKKILDESCDYRFFSYEAFEFFRLFSKVVEFILDKKEKVGEQGKINKESVIIKREDVSWDDIRNYLRISCDFRDKHFKLSKILVAPFTTKREKMYPEIQGLVDILKSRFGEVVEVIGDRKLSMEEVAYKVMNSEIFISVDTGIMHFRIFSGRPYVVIFGPTNHLKWASAFATVVRMNLWCSPCSKFAEVPPCPRGQICMKIPVDQILAQVERLMN